VTTKAATKAAEVEARRVEQYDAKVRRLTGQTVSQRLAKADVLAAYAAGTTADDFAAQVAAREPVGRVVHPLKADAVKDAGDRARATVEKVRADLEAHGWKKNACAPYPRHNAYTDEGRKARAKASLYGSLTKEDEAATRAWHDAAPQAEEARREYFRAGRPEIVRMSQWGVDRFIATAEEVAAFEYDAFICKLVAKVGDCDDAALEGSHVWGHSILTVRKGDTVERWKTQQIWNYSKLGNAYPQWPTRIVK
jgi:hypothetical protein